MNATPRKSTFTRSRPKQDRELSDFNAMESRRVGDKIAEHLFQKGTSGNPRGRPKGSKDKVAKELRSAVLDAGSLAGYDVVVRELVDAEMERIEVEDPELFNQKGLRRIVERKVREFAQGELTDYLRYQADRNPTAFLSVLGKVLPKQIDMNVQLTSRDVLTEMASRRDELADLRKATIEAAKGVDYHAEDDDE